MVPFACRSVLRAETARCLVLVVGVVMMVMIVRIMFVASPMHVLMRECVTFALFEQPVIDWECDHKRCGDSECATEPIYRLC